MPLVFDPATEGAYLHKCGNWYTRVPNSDPQDICNLAHTATACCHYNEKPAGAAEVMTAVALRDAETALAAALADLPTAHEKLLAAELAVERCGELLKERQAFDPKTGQTRTYTNAEAFVLPGRDDGLWYDIYGLRDSVNEGRRPASDLVTIERIVRVARGQAAQAGAILAEAKARLAQPAVGATTVPTEEGSQKRREVLAKARAAKAAKAAARNTEVAV